MKIFGIVGWKNAGKTGLMERLVAEITTRDVSVSTIKHAHHEFDVDQQGKDSFRHRLAGAQEVLLASRKRWALMHELREKDEPDLKQLLAQMSPVDLVLIEGYKRDGHAKIEAFRGATGSGLLDRPDPTIIGMASDQQHPELGIPVFDLNDTRSITTFILTYTGLAK